MNCRITNCNHKKSKCMRYSPNNCWDLWQTCPCCTNELIILDVLELPTNFRNVNNYHACAAAIKKELEESPKEPDQELVEKIKLKKRMKNTLDYTGVVM